MRNNPLAMTPDLTSPLLTSRVPQPLEFPLCGERNSVAGGIRIDTANESLLALKQAADELPRRRRGRKVHVSCIYRWSTVGCKGVVLETIQIGGTRCASREAPQRFVERLSQPAQVGVGHVKSAPIAVRTLARAADGSLKKPENVWNAWGPDATLPTSWPITLGPIDRIAAATCATTFEVEPLYGSRVVFGLLAAAT